MMTASIASVADSLDEVRGVMSRNRPCDPLGCLEDDKTIPPLSVDVDGHRQGIAPMTELKFLAQPSGLGSPRIRDIT
jgi:hypothetical protein